MPRYKESGRKTALGEARNKLIESAVHEFAENGYDGANVNNISLAAGFAKGTVYNYFASKRALMLAVIDDIARLHFQFVAGQVRVDQDPIQRLKRFFEAGIDFIRQYPPQARLITSTLYGPDEAFKQHIYQDYVPFFDLVGDEIVKPGIAQGVFEAPNPPATASLIMVTYLGCCAQMNYEGTVWLDAKLVGDFVLRSLRPSKRAR